MTVSVALSDKVLAFSLYSTAVDTPAMLTLSVILTSKELDPEESVLIPVIIPLMWPWNLDVDPAPATTASIEAETP